MLGQTDDGPVPPVGRRSLAFVRSFVRSLFGVALTERQDRGVAANYTFFPSQRNFYRHSHTHIV